MKRSVIVTLGGLVMTLLLLSLGTKVVLILSPDWRAVLGRSPSDFESLLASLRHVITTLTAFVYIPTAFLMGFLVGLFSSKHRISSAIIATCPAWILLVVVPPWGILIGLLIGSAAVFGAWLSKWVAQSLSSSNVAAPNSVERPLVR
jgi:hypothetical protein